MTLSDVCIFLQEMSMGKKMPNVFYLGNDVGYIQNDGTLGDLKTAKEFNHKYQAEDYKRFYKLQSMRVFGDMIEDVAKVKEIKTTK